MHIAVLGGTFDPVHYGHLRAAEEAREALGLDRIVFMPASNPPHKPDEQRAAPEIRLDMVRLAAADNPGFEVSSLEIERGGKSYTIDTVNELKGRAGNDIEVSLVMGTDSFNEITSWLRYRELLELVNIIVVPRPGSVAPRLVDALPVEVARNFWYDSVTESYRNSAGRNITYLETTTFDISSSDIRMRVKEGRSIRYLLPPAVAEHIVRHGLYKKG